MLKMKCSSDCLTVSETIFSLHLTTLQNKQSDSNTATSSITLPVQEERLSNHVIFCVTTKICKKMEFLERDWGGGGMQPGGGGRVFLPFGTGIKNVAF